MLLDHPSSKPKLFTSVLALVRIAALLLIGFLIILKIYNFLFKPKQNAVLTNQQKRNQRYGGNYIAIQAMLSSTGDPKRDEETLKNTIQNQCVPKVPESHTKEKPRKSLKINLDINTTYAFEKQQTV